MKRDFFFIRLLLGRGNTASLFSIFVPRPKPFLFKGDHKYPVSNYESPTVILYAEIGSEEFSRLHNWLVSKAKAGEITYVLRHYVAVSIATVLNCYFGIEITPG